MESIIWQIFVWKIQDRLRLCEVLFKKTFQKDVIIIQGIYAFILMVLFLPPRIRSRNILELFSVMTFMERCCYGPDNLLSIFLSANLNYL